MCYLNISSESICSLSQYLSEVNDVETWINEKMQLVSSTDYGKDENASDKLLTKHKVMRRST